MAGPFSFNFAAINNALSRVTPIKPIGTQSTSNFINNQVSRNKTSPGDQARATINDQATQSLQKVSNYQGNLRGIQQWSRGVTNTVQQNNLVRRATENAQAQQQAQLVSLQGRGSGPQFVNNVNFVNMSGARAQLVKQATSMLGTPYAWGGGGFGIRSSRGTGKGTQNVIGVDCSGLTSYVYGTLGIRLARQSDAQLRTSGYKTSVNNLQPGDLVGWRKGGHVAIYIGNGQIIESPRPGLAVRVRSLSNYDFNGGVYGVRIRLPGE